MFGPSLHDVFRSARSAHHYDIIAGPEPRFSASGPEDSELMLAAVERLRWLLEARQQEALAAQANITPAPTVVPMPVVGSADRIEAPTPSESPIVRPATMLAPPPVEEVFLPVAPVSITSTPLTLSKLAASHVAQIKRQRKTRASTVAAAQFGLTLLQDLVGDKPAADVTTEDLDVFTDALAHWPVRGYQRAEFAHMDARSIVEKAKREDIKALGLGTQRKHVLYLKSFFHWCLQGGEIKEDPTRLVDMARYHRTAKQKKEAFTAHDLRALFEKDAAAKLTNPLRYWGPMIALFTGMRVTEIAQLYLEDVKEEELMDDDGQLQKVLYFDIHGFRKGQRVKSDNAIRKLPVHDTLLELGFAKYLDDVRKAGSIHLFPGLSWGESGPGHALSSWFNKSRLRKECNITTERKTLHCFRHTVNTLADRSIVPEGVMRTINGHSDGQDIRSQHYTERGRLLECKHWLNRIHFPTIDFLPYESGRFDETFKLAAAVEAHERRAAKEGKVVRKRGRPRKVDAAY